MFQVFRSALVCMKALWKLYKFLHHPSLEYSLLFGHRVCPFYYEDAEARAVPSCVLQEALYWCRTVSFYRGGPYLAEGPLQSHRETKHGATLLPVGCKWSLEAARRFVFCCMLRWLRSDLWRGNVNATRHKGSAFSVYSKYHFENPNQGSSPTRTNEAQKIKMSEKPTGSEKV